MRKLLLEVLDAELSDLAHVLGLEGQDRVLDALIATLVAEIDKTPAVLWAGKGGVKGRLLAVLDVPE